MCEPERAVSTSRNIGYAIFYFMREMTRDKVPRALPFRVRIEIPLAFRQIDVRWRKGVDRFASEVLDNAYRRMLAKQIFLDEGRAEFVEYVTDYFWKSCEGREVADAARRTLERWLHDVRRTELRKNGIRHLARVHAIVQTERNGTRHWDFFLAKHLASTDLIQ